MNDTSLVLSCLKQNIGQIYHFCYMLGRNHEDAQTMIELFTLRFFLSKNNEYLHINDHNTDKILVSIYKILFDIFNKNKLINPIFNNPEIGNDRIKNLENQMIIFLRNKSMLNIYEIAEVLCLEIEDVFNKYREMRDNLR
jgi:hypothetical protein